MSRLSLLAATIPLILTGCAASNSRVATRVNTEAALNGNLPTNPLQWRVITSGVDPHNSTMFTLFGNDVAIQYSRTSTEHNYPDGSVLSLVTWQQQEDSRWFGAKIPAQPKLVEFVTVRDDGKSDLYQSYEGFPLKETISLEPHHERVAYLLSQRASVMP